MDLTNFAFMYPRQQNVEASLIKGCSDYILISLMVAKIGGQAFLKVKK